jgi:Protein of unknown function (DUF4232)
MSMFTRTSVRVASFAVALAATSGLVAACGSAPGPSQPGATTAPAPAVTVTVTASAGGSAAPTRAPTSPASPASPASPGSGGAGLAACRTASLLISVDDSQAGGSAGSAYYPLNFTNTSAKACELYGYPGVSFVAAPAGTGQQIGAAAQRSRAFAKVAVRLVPGGTAHAWLQVTVAGNYPESTCQPVTAHWLRVFPPGETQAGYVGHSFSACSSASPVLLTVLPVRAGKALAGITP